MNDLAERWRRCSSCKQPIAFDAQYWVCNVSTCNRKRTGLAFCSVTCWDAHLSSVRHRESWAEEKRAPKREQWQREQRTGAEDAAARAVPEVPRQRAPRRILPAASATPSGVRGGSVPREVLIVASKLKAYVRASAGMSTSDRALDPLSDAVRRLCDAAIRKARAEGRKTLLERDFD